jgi:hypothetical protein
LTGDDGLSRPVDTWRAPRSAPSEPYREYRDRDRDDGAGSASGNATCASKVYRCGLGCSQRSTADEVKVCSSASVRQACVSGMDDRT